MFLPAPSGELPFQMAVRAALQVVQVKIISSDWDLVAWALYGTQEKRNVNDLDGVVVLRGLAEPDVQAVVDLEALAETNIADTYGQVGAEFPMRDALWACSSLFTAAAAKVPSPSRPA